MKKRLVSIVVLALFALSVIAPSVLAADNTVLIYVAPGGSDSGVGTIESPLKTFEGAKSRVRELRAGGIESIEVIFRGGDYRIRKTTFTAEDSGTEENPIVYKAYEGETVNFKGSVTLDAKAFSPVTEASALARIRDDMHDKVVVMDLAAQGVTFGDLYTPYPQGGATSYGLNGTADYNSVYIDGVELDLAQWPNGRGYASWDTVANPYTIVYKDPEPDKWVNAKNFWLKVFNAYDFGETRAAVVSVNPTENTLSIPSNMTIVNPYSKRYKAFNLLEELDVPGEYYIDHDTMKLYLCAPYSITDSVLEFSIEGDSLVTIKNASNITFEGVTFTQSRGHGVYTEDIDNIDFINCNFTNIANRGICMSGTKDVVSGANYWQSALVKNDASYNCDIRGCNFDNTGSAAIQVIGGNVDTLTPSNDVVEDNVITRADQRYIMETTVRVNGCGVTVRGNVISKQPQQGIEFMGNDHIVEDNEISDVLREVADSAGIYQGRNQMQRGSVVRRNLLHDIQPRDSRLVSGTVALYMDDGQQGVELSNNIVVDASTAYNNNEGAAIKLKNNTFVDNNKSWAFHQNRNVGQDIWDKSMMGTIADMVNDIYDKDLYFERYPELKDWYLTKKNPYAYTEVTGNLLVNNTSNAIGTATKKWATIENNLEYVSKDIFVDPENLDYRVKSTSSVGQNMPELLTDANYDIEQNGVKTDRVYNEETQKFRLLYPRNGGAVAPTNVELFWQDAPVANKYRLVVAKDAEFNDVVYNDFVYYNNHTFENLEPATRYFWKVTAYNTTRDLKAEWNHTGSVYSFVTSAYSLLDTSMAEGAIESVASKVEFAVEGTTAGTYKEGSVNGIYSYIDLTEKLIKLRTGRYTQAALDARTDYILNYFNNKSLINRGYMDIFDYADEKYWVNLNDVSKEAIILDVPSRTAAGSVNLGHVSGSVICCFDAEMNIDDTFLCIGLNNDGTSWAFNSENRGYFLCIKNDVVELQKIGGDLDEILEVKEINLADGKRHSFKWGTVNTAYGNVVCCEVDGNMLFEYADVSNTAPYDLSLNLTLNTFGKGYIKLYPSASIPSVDEFEAYAKRAEVKIAKAIIDAYPEEFSEICNIKSGAGHVLTGSGLVDVSYASPELLGDHMMIPADALKKLMNIDVSVNGNSVSLSRDGRNAVFTEGNASHTVNGTSLKCGYSPYMKNGHLMVSLLDILPAFDFVQTVDWLNNMAVVSKTGAFNVVNDAIFLAKVAKIIDGAPSYTTGSDIWFSDIK